MDVFKRSFRPPKKRRSIFGSAVQAAEPAMALCREALLLEDSKECWDENDFWFGDTPAESAFPDNTPAYCPSGAWGKKITVKPFCTSGK